MTEPDVTVAVCTRNRPGPLAECLASLARLEPRPAEIVVLDQSDPPEADRVRALCPPSVRYVPVEPRGVGFSRQAALERTRTEILAFTDDDCRPWPGWVGAIREAFRRHPEAGGVTGPQRPEPGASDAGDLPAWVTTWGDERERVFTRPVEPSEVGGGLNMAFRAEDLRRIGGFDPLLGPGAPLLAAEDADVIHRVLRSGRAIVYAPDAVVSHSPPRTLREQERNEHAYAFGLGAWAAKGWREGDPLPGRFWRESLGRTLRYLIRRAPFDRPSRTRLRATVAWMLVRGWFRGARAYGPAARRSD